MLRCSHIKVDRTSAYYKCAVRAGFRFSNGQIRRKLGMAVFHIKCVCGRTEQLTMPMPDFYKVDVARIMVVMGGISYEHLIDDGYTPSQAEKILQPFAKAGIHVWGAYPLR